MKNDIELRTRFMNALLNFFCIDDKKSYDRVIILDIKDNYGIHRFIFKQFNIKHKTVEVAVAKKIEPYRYNGFGECIEGREKHEWSIVERGYFNTSTGEYESKVNHGWCYEDYDSWSRDIRKVWLSYKNGKIKPVKEVVH